MPSKYFACVVSAGNEETTVSAQQPVRETKTNSGVRSLVTPLFEINTGNASLLATLLRWCPGITSHRHITHTVLLTYSWQMPRDLRISCGFGWLFVANFSHLLLFRLGDQSLGGKGDATGVMGSR